MSVPPEQFARIAGKVDLAELESKLVVIVGAGSVGSQIAKELAHSGVGHLRLIDGDSLDETNVIRHALPRRDVGENKAEALTLYLAGEVPTLQVTGLSRRINDDISDAQLDTLLEDADLIVAATDDRRAQRRIGAWAWAFDRAAIFPGLYEDDGGEVFVQRNRELPCFSCWDGFRSETIALGGVTALNVDTLPVLFLAVELCLGLLDSSSVYFRRLVPEERGQQLPLLFRLSVRDELALGTPSVERRRNCPVCGSEPTEVPAGQARSPAPSNAQLTEPVAEPALRFSSPATAVDPGLGFDFDSLLGRLALLAFCVALAFLSIPLVHALINGFGLEGTTSPLGGLLETVLTVGGGLGCVGGIAGAIVASLWLLAGLVTGDV